MLIQQNKSFAANPVRQSLFQIFFSIADGENIQRQRLSRVSLF